MTQAQKAARDGARPDRGERLAEDGFLILERAMAPALLTAIRAELEPHFAAKQRSQGDFFGWRTTRLASILAKSPSAHALVLHDAIMPLIEGQLSAHCDRLQINLVEAIRIHPGEQAQAPHRDEEMWPCDKRHEYMINVMWALDDFTEENGATRLWPKTNGLGLGRNVDANGSVAADMPAGSACLFLGSLTHGGGANRSARPRTGLIVSYCLGWLKTYENQYLAYPPDEARAFAPELRELIGYAIHRPNLGHWNGQDPSVLFGAADPNAAFKDALPPAIAEELRNYYRNAAA